MRVHELSEGEVLDGDEEVKGVGVGGGREDVEGGERS